MSRSFLSRPVPVAVSVRVSAFVAAGGLVAYGPDLIDPFRRAASYVSRILRGEKARRTSRTGATNYELAVNIRTAKALGLTVAADIARPRR